MPFKISFSMTWLGWLLHSIIFSNKERKQIDSRLKFMLYFVWLFSFLNQSKNDVALQLRTGHIGFMAKTKFFKMCCQELHLSASSKSG